jgi:hypothetical protein
MALRNQIKMGSDACHAHLIHMTLKQQILPSALPSSVTGKQDDGEL